MDWHVMQAQPSFDGAVPGSIGNVPFSGPIVCTSLAQCRQVAHQHQMEGQVTSVHHSAAYPMPDWWSSLWSCAEDVIGWCPYLRNKAYSMLQSGPGESAVVARAAYVAH